MQDTPEIKEQQRQHRLLLGQISALSRLIRSRKRQDIEARPARREQRDAAQAQADAVTAAINALRAAG